MVIFNTLLLCNCPARAYVVVYSLISKRALSACWHDDHSIWNWNSSWSKVSRHREQHTSYMLQSGMFILRQILLQQAPDCSLCCNKTVCMQHWMLNKTAFKKVTVFVGYCKVGSTHDKSHVFAKLPSHSRASDRKNNPNCIQETATLHVKLC